MVSFENIIIVLLAIIFALLIEALVLRIFGEKRKKVYIAMLIMNLFTNVPLIIYNVVSSDSKFIAFVPFIISGIKIASMPFSIIGITIVETIVYLFVTGKEKKKSILYGIFCNAYSFVLGSILFLILSYFEATLAV